jgi:uncharacterized membrane protein
MTYVVTGIVLGFALPRISLATLAWVDRDGSATVPLFSILVVLALLIVSMLIFALLMQRLSSLQITSVLERIGDRSRAVIDVLLTVSRDVSHAVIRRRRQDQVHKTDMNASRWFCLDQTLGMQRSAMP